MGGLKCFRERVLANFAKMEAVFHGRHATGEMGFSPMMVASASQVNRKNKNVASDLEEHMGDSDEANEEVPNEEVQFIGAAESRSSPRSVHTISRKRRSECKTLGDSRRQMRELLDLLERDAQVQIRMREEARAQPQPSTYQQVLTKLREHPGVAARGPDFIFNVMEYIRREEDADYFIIFDNEDVRRYLKTRGFGDV